MRAELRILQVYNGIQFVYHLMETIFLHVIFFLDKILVSESLMQRKRAMASVRHMVKMANN